MHSIRQACLLEKSDTQNALKQIAGDTTIAQNASITNDIHSVTGSGSGSSVAIARNGVNNSGNGTTEPRQRDKNARKSSTGANQSNSNRPQNATNVAINAQLTANKRNSREDNSVIGSMTTWVPSTATLTQSKSVFSNDNDTKSSPPQSVAIVAGRKYIMVPKTNLMSISPSGVDTINGAGIHNSNEINHS